MLRTGIAIELPSVTQRKCDSMCARAGKGGSLVSQQSVLLMCYQRVAWVGECFPLFYEYLFPFSLMEHKRTYASSHQTTYAHPPDYTVRSTCGSSNVRVGRKQSAELHISKPQNLGNQSRRLVQSQTASGTKCMPAIHPPLACCSTSKGKHQRSVLT